MLPCLQTFVFELPHIDEPVECPPHGHAHGQGHGRPKTPSRTAAAAAAPGGKKPPLDGADHHLEHEHGVEFNIPDAMLSQYTLVLMVVDLAPGADPNKNLGEAVLSGADIAELMLGHRLTATVPLTRRHTVVKPSLCTVSRRAPGGGQLSLSAHVEDAPAGAAGPPMTLSARCTGATELPLRVDR